MVKYQKLFKIITKNDSRFLSSACRSCSDPIEQDSSVRVFGLVRVQTEVTAGSLCLFRFRPPSMPAKPWPLMGVSMTTTLSSQLSLGWRPRWPLTLWPRPRRAQTSGPLRALVCGGRGLCERTWTCWSTTATWSTRTRGWPSPCPTCSLTSSTGACTPDAAPPAGGAERGRCTFESRIKLLMGD